MTKLLELTVRVNSSNIDRIFAIWQMLNPKTWDWHQALLEGATFVSPVGTDENPESPLVPFRRSRDGDQTTWWTSNELRDCRTLGYNYPELAKAGQNVASLRQWVTDSYEWATIYGDPPPWKTLAETAGSLGNIEALPDVIRIDDTGQPVSKTPVIEEQEEEASLAERFAKIFHRNSDTAAGDARDRYRHIRPLIRDGQLIQWNLTIRVEKY